MSTCTICNKPLSRGESIRLGMGPICWANVQARAESEQADGKDKQLDPVLYSLDEAVTLIRDERGVCSNVPHIVCRHSPDGYEWGYSGSGPSELALNICEFYFRLLRNDEGLDIGKSHAFKQGVAHDATLMVYQSFKEEFIATMDIDGGSIPTNTVMAWLKANYVYQREMF